MILPVASNGRVSNKQWIGQVEKEAVMEKLKVLSWYLHGGTKEDHVHHGQVHSHQGKTWTQDLVIECRLWYQDIAKCLPGKVMLTSVWFQICCHLGKELRTFHCCVTLWTRSQRKVMWHRLWVRWRRMLPWWGTIHFQSNYGCKSALIA